MSNDAHDETRAQLAEHLRLNPDATPIEAVGATGADPSVWVDVVEAALASDDPATAVREADVEAPEPVESAERVEADETPVEEADPEPATPGVEAVEAPSSTAETWDGVDFGAVVRDSYPRPHHDVEQWMGRLDGEKTTFSPWADADHADVPADEDARYKWGIEDNYVDGDTVAIGEDDPRLGGRVFVQRDSDPYGFVDGDGVVDPQNGDVHPAFKAFLKLLGMTYTDVSTSGTGAHAYYLGEIPLEGVGQASFDIDDEPWGANDTAPSIEFYANKHLCVATGDHVAGTPTEAAEWDADALRAILKANGFDDEEEETVAHDTHRDRAELDAHVATATGADETADDVRDVLKAVDRLEPRDLPLSTRQTGEDSTGWSTWDPSYRSSDSGESLHYNGEGAFHDHRAGKAFGVLSLFAAEEGIIREPWDRLEGAEWWDAVDAARDGGAPIPSFERADPDAEAVAPLPFEQLDVLADADRERAARKRDLEIPSTRDAREELRNAIFREVRAGNTTVLDAPTALGKSHTVATEPWRRQESATGGAPVVHLHATTDARDEALAATRDSAATGAVLRGRKEASPLARGDYDPAPEADADPDPVVTIDGEPASEWFDRQCDAKGLPFSTALAIARNRNDQGLDELPPFGEEDPAVAQWDGLPRDDDGEAAVDVLHATHQFAHVPSLRTHTNVVIDEQPDFTADVGQERIRRMVNAYLRAIDAPVSTFGAFTTLARGGMGGDAGKEADRVDELLDADHDLGAEWFIDERDAHALAPDLTRALWKALRFEESDANGRRGTKVWHEPPRFDADEEHYNAGAWLSVVVDDENTVRQVRSTPDFSHARSVIGLDAHPSMPLWQLNAAPGMTRDDVLDATERRLWRRYERGLTVVQVGDATRPRSGSKALEWMNDERVRAVVERLREEYGSGFKTALATAQTEASVRSIIGEVAPDVDAENTMHFGEEKSRNDFADEDAGYVYGCMDPGDDMVLDAIAELGLDATPERAETDAGETVRAKGRGFVGDDADTADAVLASVRENHVAQAAGRYARNADDPESRATVYVHTDAAPEGFVDVEAPGVEWIASDLQREVVETLSARPSATATEISEAVGCSKEHVRETLSKLEERDLVERDRGAGAYGADVYSGEDAEAGAVDLGETANYPLMDLSRWSLAIRDPHAPSTDAPSATDGADEARGVTAGGDDPPSGEWWRGETGE